MGGLINCINFKSGLHLKIQPILTANVFSSRVVLTEKNEIKLIITEDSLWSLLGFDGKETSTKQVNSMVSSVTSSTTSSTSFRLIANNTIDNSFNRYNGDTITIDIETSDRKHCMSFEIALSNNTLNIIKGDSDIENISSTNEILVYFTHNKRQLLLFGTKEHPLVCNIELEFQLKDSLYDLISQIRNQISLKDDHSTTDIKLHIRLIK